MNEWMNEYIPKICKLLWSWWLPFLPWHLCILVYTSYNTTRSCTLVYTSCNTTRSCKLVVNTTRPKIQGLKSKRRVLSEFQTYGSKNRDRDWHLAFEKPITVTRKKNIDFFKTQRNWYLKMRLEPVNTVLLFLFKYFKIVWLWPKSWYLGLKYQFLRLKKFWIQCLRRIFWYPYQCIWKNIFRLHEWIIQP